MDPLYESDSNAPRIKPTKPAIMLRISDIGSPRPTINMAIGTKAVTANEPSR
jgi:hypothetical protein